MSGRISLAWLRVKWAVTDLCYLVGAVVGLVLGLFCVTVYALRWPIAVAAFLWLVVEAFS